MAKSTTNFFSEDEKMLLANGWTKVDNKNSNEVWLPPKETGNKTLYSTISAITMQEMSRSPKQKSKNE